MACALTSHVTIVQLAAIWPLDASSIPGFWIRVSTDTNNLYCEVYCGMSLCPLLFFSSVSGLIIQVEVNNLKKAFLVFGVCRNSVFCVCGNGEDENYPFNCWCLLCCQLKVMRHSRLH